MYAARMLPNVRSDSTTKSPLEELHRIQGNIIVPAISEAIRLLESEKFEELTSEHIRAVAEYQPIELGDERFFHKAFTTGKEIAASLGFAQHFGREAVLDDLLRLRATLQAQPA